MNNLGLIAALKNYQLWDVAIGNNYYDGRYADYRFRQYPVIASSAAEAGFTVLKYADEVLAELKKQKYNDKRKMLPPKSALRITKDRIGRIDQKIIRSTGADRWKRVLSPEGWIEVQLKYSKITDWRITNET